MADSYEPPSMDKDAYTCPHCGVLAHQRSYPMKYSRYKMSNSEIHLCRNCDKKNIYHKGELIHPKTPTAPRPNEYMPEDVEEIYSEAREVFEVSPRSAVALLRVAMEKLLDEHLEAEGDRNYEMIGDLVERNRISEKVQQGLDAIRVFGNDSVHAGQINTEEDSNSREKGEALFEAMNIIVIRTIEADQQLDELFEDIPDDKMEGIEDRDS